MTDRLEEKLADVRRYVETNNVRFVVERIIEAEAEVERLRARPTTADSGQIDIHRMLQEANTTIATLREENDLLREAGKELGLEIARLKALAWMKETK